MILILIHTHVLDEHKQEELLKLESALEEVFHGGDDFAEERFERAQANERFMRTRL